MLAAALRRGRHAMTTQGPRTCRWGTKVGAARCQGRDPLRKHKRVHCVVCASMWTHWHERTFSTSACCLSDAAYLRKEALNRAPKATRVDLRAAERHAPQVECHATRVRETHAAAQPLRCSTRAWSICAETYICLHAVEAGIHAHTRVSSHTTSTAARSERRGLHAGLEISAE